MGAATLEEVLRPAPINLGDGDTDGAQGVVEAFRAAQRRIPKHDLVALLGKGAMGEVFVAKERNLGRVVAVKRIDPDKGDSERYVRRFYAEARITAQLEHPSIVPVYELNVDRGGHLSYSMRVIRGQTLGDYIKETRRQYEAGGPDEDHGLADRLQVFVGVCDAIAYAHTRGVIHRDLKPDNVMLGAFHEVIVMDWGLATVVGSAADVREDAELKPSAAHQTQAGSLIGTPLYMAPEQARGDNDALGPWSDQASLGAILYELVTLRRAYPGADVMETLVKVAGGKPDPIEFFDGKGRVPRELKAIVRKALALRPADRYASVDELAADVRRYMQNEEVRAAPDGLPQKVMRWMSVNRGWALSIVLAVFLVAAAVSAGTYIHGQAALAAQQRANQARERALSALVGGVSERAQAINSAFTQWTALLTGMNTAAELALSQPAPPGVVAYLCRDLAHRPPDLAMAKAFFKEVSFESLCSEIAPGVDAAGLSERFRQIATLAPAFRRARLASADPEVLARPRAEQARLVRAGPLPVLFAYMGLPEGIMATYPARDTARDDYDPRGRSWYTKAAASRAPLWAAIDTKSARKGLVVTGSMGARHPATDALLGVTAVDVQMSYLIDNYLQTPVGVAEDAAEVFVLDLDGFVIVKSSMRRVAEELRSYDSERFKYPSLVARFRQENAGHATVQGDGGARDLVLWSRIPATHWVYAIVGAEADILR